MPREGKTSEAAAFPRMFQTTKVRFSSTQNSLLNGKMKYRFDASFNGQEVQKKEKVKGSEAVEEMVACSKTLKNENQLSYHLSFDGLHLSSATSRYLETEHQ